jgi:U3 small nucleolar ribonucleoprotein protein LCP5
MTTASASTVPALLTKLTISLQSAITALPEPETALPPTDGISLLDVKSEILLTYLQNLVFLIIVKIRNQKGSPEADNTEEDIVRKLVELRVYLEKGVRPLESKLKYQIDKVLRAADTSDRAEASKPAIKEVKKSKMITTNEAVSGSEDESDDSYGVEESLLVPNAADFTRPSASNVASAKLATRSKSEAPSDGIYRPPRITPTSLPTSTFGQFNDRATSHRAARPQRSSAVDEYINTELSTAPIAEPSIGSTIVSGGRRTKSAAERAREAERQNYEESNFVRLPKEGKKVEAQRRAKDRGTFGGEEMRGLGEGLDRIERLTGKRKGREGGGRDTQDTNRGEGFANRGGAGKRRKIGGKR